MRRHPKDRFCEPERGGIAHGRNNPLPPVILGLRSGCCPDPEEGRHLIRGNVYTTARDEDGFHLSTGELREVPWVAIKPVVNAIRVLERFVPDGVLLFDQSAQASWRACLPGRRIASARVL